VLRPTGGGTDHIYRMVGTLCVCVCVLGSIMNRSGSLTTTARELSRYKLDLVDVQEVT